MKDEPASAGQVGHFGRHPFRIEEEATGAETLEQLAGSAHRSMASAAPEAYQVTGEASAENPKVTMRRPERTALFSMSGMLTPGG